MAFLKEKDASSILAWRINFFMDRTTARVQFKKHFGKANQYLVTTIIALDTLKKSDVKNAPEGLRTSWSPQNKGITIERSRAFVLKSFLGWAVDSIDMYLSLLNRKPSFIQDNTLSDEINSAGHSVYGKVQAYSKHYGITPETKALVDILITWRNNVFHELADKSPHPADIQILRTKAQLIKDNYRGLLCDELIEKSAKGGDLTFKEGASLIQASHNFIGEVDKKVIDHFDVKKFCIGLIQDAINNKKTKFAAKYFGLTQERRNCFINNWLKNNYGLIDIPDEIIEKCSCLERS